MFSISKAFRVLSLLLVAVLVPATAFAGTTGYTAAAKQGQATQARPTKGLKLKKKAMKVAKADKADKKKPKADKNKNAGKPKVKVLKRKH